MPKRIRLILERNIHAAAIAAGGSLGALTRFAVLSVISNQMVAILVCNIGGSFILAATKEFRKRLHPDIENLVSIGFCGGLSIFASFSKYSVLSLKVGDYAIFILNTAANFAFCALSILAAQMIVEKIRQTRDEAWQKRHPVLAFARNAARATFIKLGGGDGGGRYEG